jgi:hypothetical protein
MPFSVMDVQEEYMERASDVASAKVRGIQHAGVLAGRVVGGYAAGYTMHLGAIGLVNRGADFALKKLGAVDDEARVLSGLLVGAAAAALEVDGLDDVLAIRGHLYADIRDACIELASTRKKSGVVDRGLNKRIDMMQAAAGTIEVLLDEMVERDGGHAYRLAAGRAPGSPAPVPQLVGMSALAAQWLLHANGIKTKFQDAQGNGRMLLAKQSYHVVSQSVPAGGRAKTVALKVQPFPTR